MRVHIDTDGTPASLKATFARALEPGVQGLIVLACDANGYTPETVDPLLRAVDVPIFGGVFPATLAGDRRLERGSVVVALGAAPTVHVVEGVSDPSKDFEALLDGMVAEDDDSETLMVFVDGLAERTSAFIDGLYAIFGLEINYVGGGAGSLSFQRTPCIVTNDGLKSDAAVAAGLRLASGVGVSHGWSTVDGPFKVTESDGNVVVSLDWKPAFDVYRTVVEAHSGQQFISRPFFDIAKAYPFGIAKMGAERVVRDPLALDDAGGLICVGEMPQGSYVDILSGGPAELIEAAGRALDKAWSRFPKDRNVGVGALMDCVSRVLFLEERFDEELHTLTHKDVEFFGACTLGEIANSGQDYLEFYNKTSVVAFLEGE